MVDVFRDMRCDLAETDTEGVRAVLVVVVIAAVAHVRHKVGADAGCHFAQRGDGISGPEHVEGVIPCLAVRGGGLDALVEVSDCLL